MTGDTDLARMLSTLDVIARPDRYTFASGDWPALVAVAEATIHEEEGPTYVVTVEDARAAGAEVEFVAAWLTLTVWSALEAVGLTAAVSTVLAEASIPCNVLAGFHHDHLLVPADRADEAIALLRGLAGGC